MSKRVKSQWDFGELLPPAAGRQVLSVSELTGQVRRLLEGQIGTIWVTGEISNYRLQSSGHAYFTLKDAGSQLSCVLFRGEAGGQREHLADGQKVILRGEVTVYEPRGQYQLRVTAVELAGVGALQIAFAQLKAKLEAEGLFAADRKRPLPRFPARIGLVTSPTGAAIRDVLHVIRRRQPSLEIILAPCRVQGEGAAAEIAAAIRNLNAWEGATISPTGRPALDLILVTRGGGSLEDLWAFNEEVVARAIFHSNVPVVSAVGHEIDFTIGDFVADLRAATPSAAAEIITEGVFSARDFVAEFVPLAAERLRRKLALEGRAVAQWQQRLARNHPRHHLEEKLQHLDELQADLRRNVLREWLRHQTAWTGLTNRLQRVRPRVVWQQQHDRWQTAAKNLTALARLQLRQQQNRLEMLNNRLRLLSPEQVLARGYSITMDAKTGQILRSGKDVRPGQRLRTKLAQGEIESAAIKDELF